MQVTYLGHAGFLVETNELVLVTDPWLSAEGAFDSAWFQYPCNHHLASFVREKLSNREKKRFVYISHEHRDHFDPDFLKTLPARELTFLVPRFQRDALRSELGHLNPEAVIPCCHAKEIPIPGGGVKLYLDDAGLNRDSAILVRTGEQTFLNLNDCKLYDEVAAIAKNEGPISILSCQFSGATWHPTCYDYEPAEYRRISKHKLTSKFEMVARVIDAVRPRFYVPSAGPACFLDPALLHLNFEPVNIFPRAPQFLDYLRQRLPGLNTAFVDMMPGDAIRPAEGKLDSNGIDRVDENSFESYIRSYAARYQDYFAQKNRPPANGQITHDLERLKTALEKKLAAFTLYERIRVPLYLGMSDATGAMLRIDFPNRTVERVSAIAEADYYSLTAPSWQLARILDGAITWEEFALTFRMRLNRKPDVYQTLIQGFLLMEPEDMNWFCQGILEIEQRQKRIVVEAGGMRYSIDRYCPHQGGDLSQGWEAEGKLWTCPRHRWQFALDKSGQCLTSNGSIHAVCLEND